MNRYLLLRDNKQTGPYTVAELAEKGIKAYDLVWLDGKSAAWRYPSEVEELKAFSPAVEEQPFDRFFKKPSDKEIVTESALERARKRAMAEAENAAIQYRARDTSATVPVQKADAGQNQESSSVQPVKETHEVREFVLPVDAKSSSKKVYVDLPGKAPARRKERVESVVPPVKQQVQPKAVKSVQPLQTEHERFMPVSDPVKATPVNDLSDDTINNNYTPTYNSNEDTRSELRPMIPVSGKRSSRPTPAMLLIGALCLLLGGVVIGLIISNGGSKDSSEDLGRIIAGIKAREEEKKAAQQRTLQVSQVSQPLSDEPDNFVARDVPEERSVPQQKTAKKIVPTVAAQGNTDIENKSVKSGTKALPSQKNEETGIRTSVTREDKPQITEASENARKNIRQLVSVQKNKYRTGVLGGISDLELTLSNNSEFELDMVEVEIAYLGPEKRVINTQTIVFNNIKPGKQSVQYVPKSKRGVTVNTTIRSIHSKSLGLAYSGL